MLKLATLFSGIGAIEQALKIMNIDYEIKFACDNGERELPLKKEEIDKIIEKMSESQKKEYIDNLYNKTGKENLMQKSYMLNYNINEEDFYQDVRFLSGKIFKGQIDLLVGGSPCQSFSVNGKRGGFEDTRGTLFYEYARIIQEVQPKVFIYENVRGLTTHDNGNTWQKMQKVFTETLHYKISEPKVLNAADYGIPQNRRRLFVIGIREDLKTADFIYPKEIGSDNLKYFMQDFLEDNCKYDDKEINFTYSKKDGSIKLKKVPGIVDKKYILTPKVRDYVLKAGTKNFKTSTQTDMKIARTLLRTMTQHHRAGVDNYITVYEDENEKKIRSLTERECLRLMGFPDTFKIVVSTQQMLKQAGNSIVVDVMMAILKEIYNTGVFKK